MDCRSTHDGAAYLTRPPLRLRTQPPGAGIDLSVNISQPSTLCPTYQMSANCVTQSETENEFTPAESCWIESTIM